MCVCVCVCVCVCGSSHTDELKIGTQVAIRCQAPCVTGSEVGLAGPVSVYSDRVRQKVSELGLVGSASVHSDKGRETV